MLSNETWNALNKATRDLANHIGKKITINNIDYEVVDYTLSTQIILKDKSGNYITKWYSDLREKLN